MYMFVWNAMISLTIMWDRIDFTHILTGWTISKWTEFVLATCDSKAAYALHKFSFWLNIPHYVSKYPLRSVRSRGCPAWCAQLGLVTDSWCPAHVLRLMSLSVKHLQSCQSIYQTVSWLVLKQTNKNRGTIRLNIVFTLLYFLYLIIAPLHHNLYFRFYQCILSVNIIELTFCKYCCIYICKYHNI